jgi:transcriptional regulator with XRE-family HTH domain
VSEVQGGDRGCHEYAVTTKNRSRLARERAGLTIGQAAKLIGIERGDLIRIEDLDSAFWDASREKLADVYGVNVPWLNGLSEQRDYEALKHVPGAADLPVHDRGTIAEIMAACPQRSPKHGG